MAAGHADGALHETEARRLDLIAEIGKARDSAVIAYLTSTRRGIDHPRAGSRSGIDDDDTAIIETHVRAARQMGAKNLDLFLMTEGGDAVMPWGLASMVREYFRDGKFRVLLPSVAYSAGAAICLGADEIVMGPSIVLGPVDIQAPWWNASGNGRYVSASDFQGFLDLIADNRIGAWLVRRKLIDWLGNHADAMAIGQAYRLWRHNKAMVLNLLKSRRDRLGRAQSNRIARFMLYGSAIHAQSIRRREARAQGLSFITDVEKTGLEPAIGALFAIYADVLKLRTPFARASTTQGVVRQSGDEFDYDSEGRHLTQTPVAIVESLHDTNPAYTAFNLRHWDKVPGGLGQGAPEMPTEDAFDIFALEGQRRAPARFVSARSSGRMR